MKGIRIGAQGGYLDDLDVCDEARSRSGQTCYGSSLP